MASKENKLTLSRRSAIKNFSLLAGLGVFGIHEIPKMRTSVLQERINKDSLDIIKDTEPLSIIKIEGIRFRDNLKFGGRAGFCWVRITTNSGIIGMGETYPGINGELGNLKDIAPRFLLGKDPRDIDLIWRNIYQYQSMRNAGGSDMRMLSAIDMALLDILGKSSGLPLYRLLGGKTRQNVKVYNTIMGGATINGMKMGENTKDIVQFLLDRGITGMKIYPFNEFSFMEKGQNYNGQFISSEDLDKGVQWLKQIREAAGNKMEILIDAGGRWNLTSSQRILKAIEPYNVIHFEDIQIPSNAQQAYSVLAAESSVPICHSETMATRYELKDFLQARALDILSYDLCWCGGPSEGKKMSDMADAYNIPTAPHTAGGPLLWVSSVHMCTAIPNFCYSESHYPSYTDRYPHFISNVPVPVNGYVSAPEAPGLGVEIRPELFQNGDAIIETVVQN
jgi:L-alanine-DL-glutamate epimerase-like enolase superfamily enzyme